METARSSQESESCGAVRHPTPFHHLAILPELETNSELAVAWIVEHSYHRPKFGTAHRWASKAGLR
jgi:hypothetical protein